MVLGRNRGWIGIELGTRAVKLAQVERGGAGLRIAACAVMQHPAKVHLSHDSDVQHCGWHADDVLAAMSLDQGFSGRRAACVLPMHLTDLDVLSLPPSGEAERRAMIAHELATLYPNDPRRREFDFWEVDAELSGDGSPTENVSVLSVPHGLVAETIHSLSDAGLHCQVMDGLPFALARAVDLRYGPGQSAPLAAVDWGLTSATFCVVSQCRPRFTRHLRGCGLGLLVQKASQALALSEDEATQVLAQYGLPGPGSRRGKDGEVQEALREVTLHQLHEMADELNKTISYVRMKYPAIVPERLCLFGEGASVKNVTTHLSEKIGLPVEVWQLPGSDDQNIRAWNTSWGALGAAIALSALAWAS